MKLSRTRRTVLALGVLLTMALVTLVIGCGETDTTETTENETAVTTAGTQATQTTGSSSKLSSGPDWPKQLQIAGPGGAGSSSYLLMAGLGLLLEHHTDISTSMRETMGFDGHVLFRNGDIQIAMLGSTSGPMCLMGTGAAQEVGAAPYRAIVGYTTTTVDVVVLDKSGVKRVKDIEGRTLAIGPKNLPFAEGVYHALTKAYGVDESKVKLAWYESPSEALEGLKTGAFDAAISFAEHPYASYTELFGSHKGHILDLGEKIPELVELAPEGVNLPATIPAGTYDTMTADCRTFGGGSFIAVPADLSEDFVYQLTKLTFDNQEEWEKVHISAREISTDKVVALLEYCPMHTGAIKYYKEIGVWNEECDQKQEEWLERLPEDAL